MNRRKFIKSSVIAAISIPTIAVGVIPKPELESIRAGGYVNILDIEELKSHGIRAAIYSANCVDKYGTFAHETGFKEGSDEKFVRKTFVLKSLPEIWVPEPIEDHIKILKKDPRIVKSVISEIKEHMEYVCLVGYVKAPCLCGNDTCHKHWIPVVGGLTKKRYKIHLQDLNE